MSLLSLATKSVGSPDNSYQWYLHSSGNNLSGGFQVALGDGTGTGLWVGAASIGVCGAGGKTTLATLSTGTRAVTFADAAGTLFPAITCVNPTDAANSTVTAATVPSFSVTLEPSALYEFELMLLVKSVNVAVYPRWTLNGPASQTTYVSYVVEGPTATAAVYSAFAVAGANAIAPPAINTLYPIRVRGVVQTSSTTPTAAVTLDIFSSLAAYAITLCAGSSMRFRKLN